MRLSHGNSTCASLRLRQLFCCPCNQSHLSGNSHFLRSETPETPESHSIIVSSSSKQISRQFKVTLLCNRFEHWKTFVRKHIRRGPKWPLWVTQWTCSCSLQPFPFRRKWSTAATMQTPRNQKVYSHRRPQVTFWSLQPPYLLSWTTKRHASDVQLAMARGDRFPRRCQDKNGNQTSYLTDIHTIRLISNWPLSSANDSNPLTAEICVIFAFSPTWTVFGMSRVTIFL